jgi:polyphosphate kinase
MAEKEPLFTNKELSWLSFNARVLQEAENAEVPVLERLRFLGIFSSNLDEFFRVRVAGLNRVIPLGKKAARIVGRDPRRVLKEIQSRVLRLNKRFDRAYEAILASLAEEKVFILNEHQLTPGQAAFVAAYFREEVRPKLVPVMIDQVSPFPELRDRVLYLAAALNREGDPAKAMQALIEVPTHVLPRFLILPPSALGTSLILLDDVIRFSLSEVFSIFRPSRCRAYTVKLTRDAELEIDDDLSESYVRKVSKSLKQRKGGRPVRFIYDAAIPRDLLKVFIKRLKLTEKDSLIPGGRYHNFKDFMNFPEVGPPRLRYRSIVPLPHKDLSRTGSLFEVIRKKDALLHYPYQSFTPVIDLLREASIDPKVRFLKFTLYRLALNSSVANALINAVKNGKTVSVVMELQARFDEEANIAWSNRLQEEGVRVIYGVPGLKVHAKLCLIGRRERGQTVPYALIGTGNFNEDTARVYSDHCLFTSDRRLTGEVSALFDFFEKNYQLASFRHLMVSPFALRKKLSRLIQTEVENAGAGRPAGITAKVNHLADEGLIRELYQAGRAGVPVKLLVRGMFSLVPGVPGLSRGIAARSIVDKFLEHTRILVFANAGREKYFIGSADLMPRNLDSRVEVMTPVYDLSIQRELRTFLEIQWQDNVKARILDKGLKNSFWPGEPGTSVRAQWDIYDFLKSL